LAKRLKMAAEIEGCWWSLPKMGMANKEGLSRGVVFIDIRKTDRQEGQGFRALGLPRGARGAAL
jgi:hypothetical protein